MFNAIGYYGLFFGLALKNRNTLIERLDSDIYSGSDAITLKIPFSLPYSSPTQENYKRVDGQFDHDGEIYRLVKQKLFQDTLYIVCIKDKEGKAIKDACRDFTKSLTDKPTNTKSDKTPSLLVVKDFLSCEECTIARNNIDGSEIIKSTFYFNSYSKTIILSLDHPPKLSS